MERRGDVCVQREARGESTAGGTSPVLRFDTGAGFLVLGRAG
jgi:hypothetical protein